MQRENDSALATHISCPPPVRNPQLDGLGLYNAGESTRSQGVAPGMSFRLTPEFVEAQGRQSQPPFGFNGLGELVYQRTYARYLKEDSDAREEW